MSKYNDWTRKQVEAYHSTRQYLYTLFGGAKGGGKSVCGTRIFQCDVSNHSDGIFIVMRKNYTVLRNTTQRSFDKFFDPSLAPRKVNTKWYCVNNNQIWFWAADRTRDPDYEKTRGLEATAIMFDEASEGDQLLYELLPSLLRQPAINLDTRESWLGNIFMTSNPVPGMNYLKRNFIDPKTRKRDGKHNFILSLPDENPLLPSGYIERSFDVMSEPLRRMLRYGDWDVEANEFQIVIRRDLEAIAWDGVVKGRVVGAGIDIGLGRPDKTVLWLVDETGHMWRETAWEEYDTTIQVKALAPYCQEIANNGGEVWIDSGSVGKGPADQLSAMFGNRVIIQTSFGESPKPESNTTLAMPYADKRAQLYFWSREDVTNAANIARLEELPPLVITSNDEIEEELENTYYLPVDGKLRIEPKQNIKERIGRSPDDADAFVLCNAARRSVKARPVFIPSSRRDRRKTDSGITRGYD